MSLKRAATAGAKWTSISSAFGAIVQFAQITVLAWLLRPADFGLMAMVMIVLNFAQIYSDLGISLAIVQRQDSSNEQLSSLYWLSVVMGVVVFGILLAAAPFVAGLYGESQLGTLVPAISLLFLIAPLGSQFGLLMQKHFEFKKLALIEISAATAGAIVAIMGACHGFEVYSLVVGQLASTAITTLCFVVVGLTRWRPALHFRYSDVRGYLGFGLYQIGERSLNLIGSRIDQFLIGVFLGPEALGYYSFAWNLIIQPVNRINPILTRVAFPFFSQLQGDTERMRRGFLILLKMLSTINAPILLGISAVAPIFVPLIYGQKWEPAIVLVQLLAGVGFLRAMTNPVGTLMLAKGRADIGFYWGVAVSCVQVVGIAVSVYNYGTTGAAVGLLILHVFYLTALYWFIVRILIGPYFGRSVDAIVPAVLIAGVMAVLVWALPLILPLPASIVLAVQILAGVAIYGGLSMALQPAWTSELLLLLRLK